MSTKLTPEQLSDEWADVSAPCDGVQGAIGSLMHLKQKYPHLQVVLSIGGSASAETFPVVASSAGSRDNFARSARGLVEASGMDGIDGESFLFFLLPPVHPALLLRQTLGLAGQWRRGPPSTFLVPTNQDVVRRCDIGSWLTAND